MLTRLIAALVSLFICIPAYAQFGGISLQAGNSTVQASTVTANLASTSFTVPTNFVGWSQEQADVIYYPGFFDSTNASFVNLTKLLGPCGFIRVGGNTQDTPNSFTSTTPVWTSGLATGLANMANALGSCWTINVGLDLKHNNSTQPMANITAINAAFSGLSNTLMYNFGNEPDLFGISESTYQTNWNAFYTTYLADGFTNVLEATEVSSASNYAWIDGLTPGVSGLSLETTHYYQGANPTSFAAVISNSLSQSFASQIAHAPGKYRLDETNMGFDSLTQGISNATVGTAWYLNMSTRLAGQGGVGLSPHVCGSTQCATAGGFPGRTGWLSNWYNVSGSNYSPAPIFYGMYLFSKIEGQPIAATTNSGSGSIGSFATIGGGGNANIIVVNNSTTNQVNIKPAQSNSWSTAKIFNVEPGSVNGCGDVAPQTLNNTPIGNGGANVQAAYTITNGQVVNLQPCGAALIQIQP